MREGPFTDAGIKRALKVVQTQHGIVEAAEEMAKVLAEMGRASEKAVGDSPSYAIDKWCDLIRKRAKELARQRPEQKQLSDSKTIDAVPLRPET